MMDTLLLWLQPMLVAAFTLWGSPVTWLEIAALVLSLAMVVFNILVNPLGWPLAIAASLLYFVLFWQSKLYGEASLQLFFVAVAGWGWWQWLRGTQADGSALRVRGLGTRGRVAALAALAVAWPATALLLRSTTDSDVPWWDAFPTAASVIGQWLLGRKYVENWPTWLVVNVVSVALFAYKALWLTALLYAVFVVMSVIGWRAWARMAQR
ncbi:MAG: transporter [Methylibium sp. NZG]|nr:MAG: transporter [Methylibium sp. NZG]